MLRWNEGTEVAFSLAKLLVVKGVFFLTTIFIAALLFITCIS
jgi:hypothetical protein